MPLLADPLAYNVMLEREGFRKILFVGDLIPSPLAGFGMTFEKIRKQPDEIQRPVSGRRSKRCLMPLGFDWSCVPK